MAPEAETSFNSSYVVPSRPFATPHLECFAKYSFECRAIAVVTAIIEHSRKVVSDKPPFRVIAMSRVPANVDDAEYGAAFTCAREQMEAF